jgi:hypothetical protein
MRNIDWPGAEQRLLNARKVLPPPRLAQPEFDATPLVTVEEVQAMLKPGARVQLIDARPRHYITRASEIVEGAVWRDPERVEDWIGDLNPTTRSSTSASTGFTSAARPRRHSATRALTPVTCRVGTTSGKPCAVRRSSSSSPDGGAASTRVTSGDQVARAGQPGFPALASLDSNFHDRQLRPAREARNICDAAWGRVQRM